MCNWASGKFGGIPFEVAWAITIPQWNGLLPKDRKNDFYGSIGKNSAYRGPLQTQWAAIGTDKTTLLAYFLTSDFCTAWQVCVVSFDCKSAGPS
jgi:hypothetical protein